MTRSFIACLLLVLPAAVFALEVPYLSGHVVDEAQILSASTEDALSEKLAAHEKATSNQVVVLTIPSLEGEVLEQFSLRTAETWKLGQKDKDNGVLLLIARDERKLRIEVGYGLEGDLTDVQASRIIRGEIVPHFKDGDFDGGITAGVEAILGTIEGTYTPSETETTSEGFTAPPLMFRLMFGSIWFSVVGLFTITALIIRQGVAWFFYLFLIPFWGAGSFVVFGWPTGAFVFLGYLLLFPVLKLILPRTPVGAWAEKNIKVSSSSGGGFSSSSSGWSSGGGFSSGGFSGGGGSFGGGGSSGSW